MVVAVYEVLLLVYFVMVVVLYIAGELVPICERG